MSEVPLYLVTQSGGVFAGRDESSERGPREGGRRQPHQRERARQLRPESRFNLHHIQDVPSTIKFIYWTRPVQLFERARTNSGRAAGRDLLISGRRQPHQRERARQLRKQSLNSYI